MADKSDFRPDLKIFGVGKRPWMDLRFDHGELLRIGKTTNPEKRLKCDAKTWLPDMTVLGVKPFWNIGSVDRSLHIGLARYTVRAAGEVARRSSTPASSVAAVCLQDGAGRVVER